MNNQSSSDLFRKNRSKLREYIPENAMVLLFSNQSMPRNGDQTFPYRENSDFYYFTGIEQENSALLMTSQEDILFIPKQSETNKLWEGEKITPDKAHTSSGIEHVEDIRKLDKIFAQHASQYKQVFFNITLPINQYRITTPNESYFNLFRTNFPVLTFSTIKPTIDQLRLKKEYEEIERIKQGIDITNKAFHRILHRVTPGINENELEAELRHEFQLHRTVPAYDPILASGKNACTLHYIDNNDTCRENDLLLMDIGAEIRNYASDISRTIPVSGSYTRRQKECYEAVLEVQKQIIQTIDHGMSLLQLNQMALEWLTEKHIELGLYSKKELDKESLTKKYFPHGVGHFMGLDVHDTGNKNTLFEPGMVITCEPGIYIPEEGIGIRIEDNIFIDEHVVNLSEQIPKEIAPIEQLMSR